MQKDQEDLDNKMHTRSRDSSRPVGRTVNLREEYRISLINSAGKESSLILDQTIEHLVEKVLPKSKTRTGIMLGAISPYIDMIPSLNKKKGGGARSSKIIGISCKGGMIIEYYFNFVSARLNMRNKHGEFQ